MGRLIAVLVAVAPLVAAPAASPTAPVPAVRELRVGPIAETRMGMKLVFSGPDAPCGERLKGSVSVVGSGRIPREAVKPTEPTKAILQRFVAVKEVRIGSLGVGTSTLNVEMELKNPLAFDLQFVGAAYELTVDGEPLARGRKANFLLHAAHPNQLLLPVDLSHAGILSGLWKAAINGSAEGVLTGTAMLHVPAGELDLPFEFPVTLSWK